MTGNIDTTKKFPISCDFYIEFLSFTTNSIFSTYIRSLAS